jgi:tight adherence protein B
MGGCGVTAWILFGSVLAVVLAVAGLAEFATAGAERREITAATRHAAADDAGRGPALARLSRRFTRSRLGHRLEQQLVLAGIGHPPLAVFAACLAATVTIPYVLGNLLAPAFGALGLLGGYVLLRIWLQRARERRREKFVQQIPELARILSNATNAGLSIATAWALAEAEMAEPAKSEIQRLNAAVRFGAPLEEAMLQLNERLPSREVRVLMSTMVVSARSGGSLVKALRDISFTLDDRKEVRREIRTTLAQARSTSVLVAALGIGILLLLNTFRPGTVELMTRTLIGQAALIIGLGLFVVGFLLTRRMTRIDR